MEFRGDFVKTKKTIVLILVLFLYFSCLTQQKTVKVKAEETNPLTIEKIIGLSKEPGTFRMVSQRGWTSNQIYQQGLAVTSDGSIYIGDDGEGQIEVFGEDLKPKFHFGSLGSGDGQFQRLIALMVDEKDQIYAVDCYLATVQIFKKDGSFLRKFGGHGKNQDNLSYPVDIAMLSTGELIVADLIEGVKVYSQDGIYLRDFSNNNYLSPLEEMSPNRIKVAKNGIVYFSVNNGKNGRIIIVTFDQKGNYINTVLDDDTIEELAHGFLPDIAVDDQYFYMINNYNSISINRYKIPSDSENVLKFKNRIADFPEDKLSIEKTDVFTPTAIFVKNRKIYYLDGSINRLVILSEELEYLGTIQSPIVTNLDICKALGKGSIPLGVLENPQGVKVDSGGRILVANTDFSCISVFNSNGEPIANFGKRWEKIEKENPKIVIGDLYSPIDVVIDLNNNIFISEQSLNIVQVFDSNFIPIATINESFGYPQGMSFDMNNKLLVANLQLGRISVLKKQNEVGINYKKESEIHTYLYWPVGIAVDNKNNRIISDTFTHTIKVIDPAGETIKSVGEPGDAPGQLYAPQGVFADANSNIYVAESENGRIQKFDSDGSVLWCQNLNWNGLNFLTQDKQGKLYVTDRIHGIILVLSDSTAVPPAPKEPTMGESNASFSFSTDQKEVTEQDTFTLSVNVDQLDKVASIDMTLQYPDSLVQVESCGLGDLLKSQSFDSPSTLKKPGTIQIKSSSRDHQEKSGSGGLLELTLKAMKPGLAYFDFADITLKNSKGEKVSYAGKSALSVVIKPRVVTPPPLRLEPIPKVVFDPDLTIRGATDPHATVTIDQKEIPVQSDGSFQTKVPLTKGVNTIRVEAANQLGDKSTENVVVTRKERITITLMIGSKTMVVNAHQEVLDVSPYIDKASGRTMVPIRAITLAIGATIAFDKEEQKITISVEDTTVSLWIGNPKALVNGAEVPIDANEKVTPVIVKGRTFVPLRFVAESFNFEVAWDPKAQRITLTYPK